MSTWESIRTALWSLLAHRLRTFLAILGIVIGVASVITLLAVGQGQQAAVTAQVQRLGSNLLFVRPGFQTQGGVRGAAGTAPTLTYDDATAIRSDVAHVIAVAPEWGTGAQVIVGGVNSSTRVLGVTPEYLQVRNYQLGYGSFITDQDISARTSVAVLGATVATTLFGGEDPVGQSIRANVGGRTLTLQVIGVLQAKGGTGQGSQDDNVLVPLSTVLTRVAAQRAARGVPNVSTVSVEVDDPKYLTQVSDDVTALLLQRHRVSTADFMIQNQADILASLQTVSEAETVLLSSIAAISLLVGGIGIMNIMLVSVTERTREIGIRKAVGARQRDILQQFIVESLAVSVGGGSLGILIGMGLANAASGHRILGRLVETVVSPGSVVLSFGVSAAIGVFFGIYPAMRAARLNPVEALSYE